MLANRMSVFVLLLATGVVACLGCVLRKETITVAGDGVVVIELEITGTEEELSSGDAMPSADSGWDVQRRIERDGEEDTLVLKTRRRFEPGEALPQTFAASDDPHADLYLDFPTKTWVEQRADGVYHFFHRRYTARRWAYTQYWSDAIFGDAKKLAEKPLEELSRRERRDIVRAFATVEAYKQLEFAKAAMAESRPGSAIEIRLRARQALLEVYDKYGWLVDKTGRNSSETGFAVIDEVIDRCDGLEEDERNACYDTEAIQLFSEARTAYVQSLQHDAALSRSDAARFIESYDRAKRLYELTDTLGGQQFETIVAMPGTILAHNADEVAVDEDTGQATATWQFEGKAFRDRPHELWVVSRVTDETQRSGVNDDGR